MILQKLTTIYLAILTILIQKSLQENQNHHRILSTATPQQSLNITNKNIFFQCHSDLIKADIPENLKTFDLIETGTFDIKDNDCQNYSAFTAIDFYFIKFSSNPETICNQIQPQGLKIQWNCNDTNPNFHISLNTLIINTDLPENYTIGSQQLTLDNSNIQVQGINTIKMLNLQYQNFNQQILLNTINNINIQNININNFRLSNTPALQISDTQNIQIKKSSFTNNNYTSDSSSNGGALSIIKNSNLIEIINSTFSDNSGFNGGALYINEANQVNIQDSFIIKNKAVNGAGIFLQNFHQFTSQQNTYEENTGLQTGYGGGLNLKQGNITEFQNDILHENSCDQQGGAIIMTKIYESSKFISVNFTHNKAQFQGAAGKFYEVFNMEMNDCRITDNQSQENGGGLEFFLGQNITLNNMHFQSNIAEDWGGCIKLKQTKKFKIFDSTLQDCQVQNRGGAICAVSGSDDMTLKNITFQNNKALQIGGGIFLENSLNFDAQDLKFFENQAGQGSGLFFLNVNSSQVLSSDFKSNIGQTSGAGLQLQNSQNITLDFLNLKNNTADSGAGICLQRSQQIYLKNSNILTNKVSQNGGGILISSSNQVTLDEITFQENQALFGGAGLQLSFSNDITIQNIQFLSNIVTTIGSALSTIKSNQLTLKNIIINNTHGSAIVLEGGQEIFIQNTTLENCQSENGGGIFISQVQNLTLQESLIQENQANSAGGGIYISQSQSLYLIQVKLKKNIANKSNGGGIYAKESEGIHLKSCLIEKNEANNDAKNGGGIYIEDVTTSSENGIFLTTTTFKQNECDNRGGGFYALNFQYIEVKNNTYEENECGDEGCGLYLERGENGILQNSLFKNHKDSDEASAFYVEKTDKFSVINNIFQNNTSLTRGGAMSSSRIDDFQIHDNQFLNNSCFVDDDEEPDCMGGAVFLRRGGTYTLKKNLFKDNQAQKYGGAFHIESTSNVFISEQILDGNKVQFYGQEKIIHEKNEDYYLSQGGGGYIEIDGEFNLENSLIKNCQASSGGGILVNYKNTEEAPKIYINTLEFHNNVADLGPGLRILAGKHQKLLEQNTKNILSVNNTSFLNPNTTVQLDYFFNERLVTSDNYQFRLCSEGYQLLEGGGLNCEKCYEYGECTGGYVPIYPKKEYWKDPNQKSEQLEFFHCYKYPDSCTGNFTCKEGYSGVLCEECDILNGYTKSSGVTCNECYSDTVVGFFLLSSYLLLTLLVLSAMRGVVNKVEGNMKVQFLKGFGYKLKVSDQLSAIIKITIMHFQIFTLVESLSLNFPGVIHIGMTGVGNPAKILSRVLECFFKIDKEEDLLYQSSKVQFVGFLLSLSVVLLFIVGQLIYFLRKKKIYKKYYKKYLWEYKQKADNCSVQEQNQMEVKTRRYQDTQIIDQQLKQYIKCALLCFFITIQPGVLQNSMIFLQCRQFGEQSYCAGDTNINCSSDYYKYTVYPINLGIVIIFSIIIPFIIWLTLYRIKQRKGLKWLQNRRSYGILYMELHEKNYYWDIIIIFLKTSAVMITSFFQKEINVEQQLLVTLLIIYGILFMIKKPYATHNLNVLSLVSLGTLILTIVLSQALTTGGEQFQLFVYFVWIIIVSFNLFTLAFSIYVMFPDFKRISRKYIVTWFRKYRCTQSILQKIEKEKKTKKLWNYLFYAIKAVEQKKIIHQAETIYMKELIAKYNALKEIKQQDNISFRQLESINFSRLKVKNNGTFSDQSQEDNNQQYRQSSFENLQNNPSQVLNSPYSYNYGLESERQQSDRSLKRKGTMSESFGNKSQKSKKQFNRLYNNINKNKKKSTMSNFSTNKLAIFDNNKPMSKSSQNNTTNFNKQQDKQSDTQSINLSSQLDIANLESNQNLTPQIQQQYLQQYNKNNTNDITINISKDQKSNKTKTNKNNHETDTSGSFSFVNLQENSDKNNNRNSLTCPDLDANLTTPNKSPYFQNVENPNNINRSFDLGDKQDKKSNYNVDVEYLESSIYEEDLREDFNNQQYFDQKHNQNIQSFVNTSNNQTNQLFGKIKKSDTSISLINPDYTINDDKSSYQNSNIYFKNNMEQ